VESSWSISPGKTVAWTDLGRGRTEAVGPTEAGRVEVSVTGNAAGISSG
jgi:hypothetical protein